MLPAFDDNPVKRPVPLFWRNHIAPASSHAALRIGEWKLISNINFDKFQLYQIQTDWKEEHDLASKKPAKLKEMKEAFFEVLKGIESEGPLDWVDRYGQRKIPAEPN